MQASENPDVASTKADESGSNFLFLNDPTNMVLRKLGLEEGECTDWFKGLTKHYDSAEPGQPPEEQEQEV